MNKIAPILGVLFVLRKVERMNKIAPILGVLFVLRKVERNE